MEKEEVHLLSLPALPSLNIIQNPSSITYYPPILRQVWKWKDDTLGNGRDYILPKPRALRDFNSLLVGQSFTFLEDNDNNSNGGGKKRKVVVEECATLSNCARMDVLLSTKIITTSSSNNTTEEEDGTLLPITTSKEAVRCIVSNVLAQQVYSQLKGGSSSTTSSSSWKNDLKRFFDLPGAVIVDNNNNNNNAPKTTTTSSPNTKRNKQYQSDIQELYTSLKSTSLPIKIITHFAYIAAGMPKSHPSRPTSSHVITFRPYSSRDAHILCQMKRSIEVSDGTKVTLILQEALRAGKACRDESTVEEILVLKKFGSGKSRFGDGDVPLDLAKMAAKVWGCVLIVFE